jgi:hypothetical protein
MVSGGALDWGCCSNPGGYGRAPGGPDTGLIVARSNGTNEFYRNGVVAASLGGANKATAPSTNMYLMRREDGFYYNGTMSFAFIGDTMTGPEVVTLTSIINTYQTALGRNLY